jgi:hypothetical protein
LRCDLPSAESAWGRAVGGIRPGIYPYLGGSASAEELREVISGCGGAVVPGIGGVRLAARVQGALVDPARYLMPVEDAPDTLLDLDEWLERQRAAGVPVILTDTARIPNRDRSSLRKALARWEMIDEPTWVVLPLQSWWLRQGLPWLAEEVTAAGRPVAVVLLHHYNGLDAAGAVAGLLSLITAAGELPVVLLRCDVSAIGAVAHGAFAGFVGLSATNRHGPMPMMRRRDRADGDPGSRDDSPSVFVPALHDYFKASKIPALTRGGRGDIARCDDGQCRGESLLRIARLSEVDPRGARALAYRHNLASAEELAQRVLTAHEPRQAWWECCSRGADSAASLIQTGITAPASSWLRQWLDEGSPARSPETAG